MKVKVRRGSKAIKNKVQVAKASMKVEAPKETPELAIANLSKKKTVKARKKKNVSL